MSDDLLHIHITKRLGAFVLEVDTVLPLVGVTAIFGPSGSGKSSLLRLIAGLERPDRGTLRWADQVWSGDRPSDFLRPHLRGVSYVFQGGRLLDHLTVGGNLAYAETRARGRAQMARPDDVVAALDLAPLMARKPGTLSGGERQRAALGQALLAQPRLLLLDEPLSALDAPRKAEILPFLDRVHCSFGIPVLYVSHDLSEVTRLADKVLIMKKGRHLGFGDTVETLNTYGFETAGEGRSGIILTGHITRLDARLKLMEIAIGVHTLLLPAKGKRSIGQSVRVILKARDIALSLKVPEGLSIQNRLQGHIRSIDQADSRALVWLNVDIGADADLPVQVTRSALEVLDLRVGSSVFALVKTASLAG